MIPAALLVLTLAAQVPKEKPADKPEDKSRPKATGNRSDANRHARNEEPTAGEQMGLLHGNLAGLWQKLKRGRW